MATSGPFLPFKTQSNANKIQSRDPSIACNKGVWDPYILYIYVSLHWIFSTFKKEHPIFHLLILEKRSKIYYIFDIKWPKWSFFDPFLSLKNAIFWSILINFAMGRQILVNLGSGDPKPLKINDFELKMTFFVILAPSGGGPRKAPPKKGVECGELIGKWVKND